MISPMFPWLTCKLIPWDEDCFEVEVMPKISANILEYTRENNYGSSLLRSYFIRS